MTHLAGSLTRLWCFFRPNNDSIRLLLRKAMALIVLFVSTSDVSHRSPFVLSAFWLIIEEIILARGVRKHSPHINRHPCHRRRIGSSRHYGIHVISRPTNERFSLHTRIYNFEAFRPSLANGAESTLDPEDEPVFATSFTARDN